MAHIRLDDDYLTVLNVFEADDRDAQDRLLVAMRDIIDHADYPGWISSTLHSSVEAAGTLNFIQWKSADDLQRRYEGATFRHETVPLFNELSTSIRLLKQELVFVQKADENEPFEISHRRDDYTVAIIMDMEPENQDEVVKILSTPDEWLRSQDGYRAHALFRGVDGRTVFTYAQWSDRAAYQRFHTLPESERPVATAEGRARCRELITARFGGGYRILHARTADGTL